MAPAKPSGKKPMSKKNKGRKFTGKRYKFSMRRKSRPVASYLRPNQFVKLHWEYEANNQSIAAGVNQALTFYPMNACPFSTTASANDQLYTGLSQYTAFYTQFRVMAAKITCTVFNAGTTNVVKTALYAIPYVIDSQFTSNNSPSTVAALTLNQIWSYPGVKTRTLGLATGGRNQATLSMYRSSKKMLGKSKIKDAQSTVNLISPSLAHAVVSYPTDIWYYQLNTFNVSTAAQIVNYSIKIDAWVQCLNAQFIDQAVLS